MIYKINISVIIAVKPPQAIYWGLYNGGFIAHIYKLGAMLRKTNLPTKMTKFDNII